MMHVLKIFEDLRQGKLPPLQKIPGPLVDAVASLASLRGRWSRLSSLERVITAFRHKEPDRVPVTPVICAAARQIDGISYPDFALVPEKCAQVYSAGLEFVGGDLMILLYDLSVEAADFGQKVIFPEDSTPRPDYDDPVIKDVGDYAKIRPIDLAGAKRMQVFLELCRIMVARVGFRAVLSGFVFGPLGVLSMMRGAERLFKDCMLHPKEVRKGCEAVTETLIEFVEAQCEIGMPAITIDTLFASRNGLPKKLWEEIEGPFAGEVTRAIKKKGLFVAVHNCGHDLYFDAQIRSMEPDAISFAHLPDDCSTPREVKEKYGDQVVLIGYVPTPLLVEGTPRQVMEEAWREIEVLGKGGGYILAPGCEYPPNLTLTNAFSLVKAAETLECR